MGIATSLARARARLRARLGRPASGGGTEPVEVVLYTKAVCPLCDEVKAELRRVRTRIAWRLEVVGIDGRPELEERHGLSVPVVVIAGRPAFKGRLTAEDFARKLARRAEEDRRA